MRQGQIIGYVGSTGLSTGPHLHDEILVNNRFVDPLKIKLPRGRVLDGPTLANFEHDRDRYDGLMNRASPRPAPPRPSGKRLAYAQGLNDDAAERYASSSSLRCLPLIFTPHDC